MEIKVIVKAHRLTASWKTFQNVLCHDLNWSKVGLQGNLLLHRSKEVNFWAGEGWDINPMGLLTTWEPETQISMLANSRKLGEAMI